MLNRQTRLWGGIAALAVVTGVSAEASAVGEGVGSFPNWAERALHELSNRARVDPQTELAGCGPDCAEQACYTPMAPLRYRYELNRAARFHSDEMVKQNFFNHPSNCTVVSNIDAIYPAQCDGSASCACVGGTSTCNPSCTTTSQRVTLFNANYSGEIIASSANPVTSFYLWLYEDAMGNPACMFTQDNGHRWLILKSTAAVGFGVAGRATGDFGSGGGTTTPKIPSGSHWPRQAASVEAWANWYDTAGPQSASINVDGQCSPMQLGRGSQQNGAWTAMVNNVGTGCHRYYFEFTDSSNTKVTFPTTGSLGIGPAGSCEDWNTQRPPSCGACMPQCAGKQCGDDTCGGVCGMCAGNETCQAGQCMPTGSSSSAVSSSSSAASSSSSSSSSAASSSSSASTGTGAGGASTTSSGQGGASTTGAGGSSNTTTGAGASSGTGMATGSGASGSGTGGGQGGLGGGGSSGGDNSEEGSCGCRTVGGGAGNPIGWLSIGLVIALASRRRR
jgi:MYXO-CTERM domain-containing protein